ncbi:MAG: DUF5677 domain-containing protein, partial [Paracoccaceae bacterium]|nr:DUF5677 domain-containing protein [Paracoccaceae bacterium]
MYEKYQILQNPPDQNLFSNLESLNDVNRIALTVCQDTILTYRKVTLSQANNGYGLTEAPIIGLLTRITKLLKLISKFYEMGKADNLSIYTRSLIESATIAVYLIQNGDEAIKDFRLCSYKHTLKILYRQQNGDEFFQTPAGKCLREPLLNSFATHSQHFCSKG